MYFLILLFPLLGFLSAALFGRFLGGRGGAFMTTFSVLATCVLSWVAFFEVGISGSPCYVTIAPWIVSEFFDSSWGLLFDQLTVVMLIVITTVSSCVHIYSISYMESDPHLSRFMSYITLFVFGMLVLVTSDNFVQLFFGWEFIGLASFLPAVALLVALVATLLTRSFQKQFLLTTPVPAGKRTQLSQL